jgi:hypothetical protein
MAGSKEARASEVSSELQGMKIVRKIVNIVGYRFLISGVK